MMDWVPAVSYGATVSVAAASTVYVILYPLPDYIADQEFLYEDEVTSGLFLHRIVGSVTVSSDDAGNIPVAWRLMPLGCNYDTLSVLEPFATPWSADQSEWANLRWWDERRYIPTSAANPDLVDHPYWTRVDITPKQAFGQKRNLWPVLAIRNYSAAASMRLRHNLRLLLS